MQTNNKSHQLVIVLFDCWLGGISKCKFRVCDTNSELWWPSDDLSLTMLAIHFLLLSCWMPRHFPYQPTFLWWRKSGLYGIFIYLWYLWYWYICDIYISVIFYFDIFKMNCDIQLSVIFLKWIVIICLRYYVLKFYRMISDILFINNVHKSCDITSLLLVF